MLTARQYCTVSLDQSAKIVTVSVSPDVVVFLKTQPEFAKFTSRADPRGNDPAPTELTCRETDMPPLRTVFGKLSEAGYDLVSNSDNVFVFYTDTAVQRLLASSGAASPTRFYGRQSF